MYSSDADGHERIGGTEMKNSKNKEKFSFKGALTSRKFKFGSLAVTLTVFFVALVILANIIIGNIFSANGVYSDLTGSSIYTLSDEAKAYLDRLNCDITIKFAQPVDTITSNAYQTMIYRCAKDYEEASKSYSHKITVESFDAMLEPTKFEEYKKLISTDWADTNVIVENANGQAMVFTQKAFFSSDNSTIVGFSGERKFMNAFLQLGGLERTVVCFTVGHGEVKGTQNFDANGNYVGYTLEEDAKYEEFFRMFDDSGFELRWINLLNEDIPSECRLLIILDPKTDFIGKELDDLDGISEIDKVKAYAANINMGSTMVFKGSGVQSPNLDQLLAEYNIEIDSTKVIKESTENSISADGSSFTVKYTTEGLGASIQQNYRNLRTKFVNASPVTVHEDYDEYATISTSSIFTTSSSAQIASVDENGESGYEIGSYGLMAIAEKRHIQDNSELTGYLLACGCPEMLEYVGSQSYANRDIINTLIQKLPLKKTPVDLDYKKFDDYGLSSITSNAVSVWSVILAGVMPACVLIAGCVVVIRRKRR